MSSKINVIHIVSEHFTTLKDASTGKRSIKDIFSFLLIPLLISLLVLFFSNGLDDDIFTLAVNFGAISTALLMSVLVLVYDQEIKIQDRMKSEPERDDINHSKLELLSDLYQNICYTVVASILLVIFAVIGMWVWEENLCGVMLWLLRIFSSLTVFMFLNIVLTMLMIIKRFHTLLTS